MATVASTPAPTTRTVAGPGAGVSTPDTTHDAGATAGSEPTVSPAEKPIKKKRKTYDDAMLLKHLPSLQEAMTKAAFVPSRRNAARNLHHMMYVYKNWAATVWPKMSSSEFFSKTAEFKHRLRNHIKDLRDLELIRAHRSNMAVDDDIRAEEEADAHAAAAAAAAAATAETVTATNASGPSATSASAAASRKRPQTGGEEPVKKSPALGLKHTAGTAAVDVEDDDDEFGIEAFDFDDDDLDASGTSGPVKSGSARADLPTEEELAAAEEAEMAGFEDDLEAMMELENEVTTSSKPSSSVVVKPSSTAVPETSKPADGNSAKINSTDEEPVSTEGAGRSDDAVPAPPSNVSSAGKSCETPGVGAVDRPASTTIVEERNSSHKSAPQSQVPPTTDTDTTNKESPEPFATQVVEQAPAESQKNASAEAEQRDETSSEQPVSTSADASEEPKV